MLGIYIGFLTILSFTAIKDILPKGVPEGMPLVKIPVRLPQQQPEKKLEEMSAENWYRLSFLG